MDIQEIGFGDFCAIEQKRYVGPNEFYSYKVVGRKKSNAWTGVPVDANNEKETLHDHLDDVVTVVCNNLDDRTVHQFRVSDLASVRKAQAVPEWISVKDQLPPSDPYNREYWVYETLNNKVQHDYWVCPDTGLDQDFEPFFNNWPREVTHWMPMVKYPKPPVQAQEPTND